MTVCFFAFDRDEQIARFQRAGVDRNARNVKVGGDFTARRIGNFPRRPQGGVGFVNGFAGFFAVVEGVGDAFDQLSRFVSFAGDDQNEIGAVMNSDYGFTLDLSRLDQENFYLNKNPKKFLGSWGKRVGPLYAGVDDFDILIPKYETSFVVAENIEKNPVFGRIFPRNNPSV